MAAGDVVQAKSAVGTSAAPAVVLDATPTEGNLLVGWLAGGGNIGCSISDWVDLTHLGVGGGTSRFSGKHYTLVRAGQSATITGALSGSTGFHFSVLEIEGPEADVDALVDTFFDTASTELDAHTSETGHTWTQQSGDGTLVVSGNQIAASGAGNTAAFYTSSYTPPSADYRLQVKFDIRDQGAMIIEAGMRCQTDKDGVWLRYNGFVDQLQLIELIGGVSTTLDTFATAAATTYIVEVEVVGDQAECR